MSIQTSPPVETNDADIIWKNNKTIPEIAAKCIHDIIASNAEGAPSKPAVHGWDGDLTYGELDQLSTRLSCELIELGVGPETIVPLFFEKSMWTVVAVVGVLKAGGAFVLLDMGLPKARLEAVIERCKAKVVCASEMHAQLCKEMGANAAIVSAASQHEWRTRASQGAAKPSPSSPLYVCFTSGSTGLPKGIVITHESFYTAYHHQAHLLGFTPDSRTFDFASYSFDVAVHNVLTTLTVGGCLCIPSDQDRKTNLNKAIRDSKATIVNLTATVARMLEPELLKPHLETLLLLGEAVNLIDLQRIWGSFTIINTYGPAECTPISTINLSATTPAATVDIGTGIGVRTWVVNPENHNQLSAYGEIGELLLEGHVLARGYLHDPDKTAAAFIENPDWLVQGCGAYPGRTGRLYKTGDLVRYATSEGDLQFIGRKDTQVKIRGQRMELGEVEHHVRLCLPFTSQLVVDVVEPEGQKDKARLAAFIAASDDAVSKKESAFKSSLELDKGLEMVQLRDTIAFSLSQVLPAYMLPTLYFWMGEIPQTPSGKTDRKRLREIGAGLSTQQIAELQNGAQAEKREPTTPNEQLLCLLWSKTIGIAADAIGLDDNFFLMGGDSVTAMRLVSDLRKSGLELSVAEIFESPLLEAMSTLLRAAEPTASEDLLPFSLLVNPKHTKQIRDDLAALCGGLDASLVEDAYPSTALQQGLLSSTSSGSTDYTLRAVQELAVNIDMESLKKAWNDTARSLPVLRTRLVHHPTAGLVQLVANTAIDWTEASTLAEYLAADSRKVMEPGTPLCRFGLVKHQNGKSHFILTLHHALYDGWSLPLVLETVGAQYRHHTSIEPTINLSPKAPFGKFIKHISSLKKPEIEAYWKTYCADGELTAFPQLPQTLPSPDMAAMEATTTVRAPGDITMSTLLRASLAMVLSQYTGSMDVVIGATVSGRNVPIADIDQIVGPTIATVPIRCLLQGEQTVHSLLRLLQSQFAQMMPYEQTGLQNIAKLSDDCRAACAFQTLLVVQPEENDLPEDSLIGKWQNSSTEEFTTYPITFECLLRANGMTIRAAYNRAIVPEPRMERMLQHLINTAEILASANPQQLTRDVNIITAQDISTVWKWNAAVPKSMNNCIHEVITGQAEKRPEAPAVHGWDESFSYKEMEGLSNKLANHLIGLGVGTDVAVPLFFDKSSWAVVAMLAVLKAGGGFLPLNASEAEARRSYILSETKAHIALVSSANENISLPEGCGVFVVNRVTVSGLPAPTARIISPYAYNAMCYIIFTSGSTGQPKGVVLEHAAVATSCFNHGARFYFDHDTRMLQFSSYTFDASIIEIITTLMHGGCVCVLSEADRLGDLAGAITKLRVNSTLLTPTVARMLFPENVPTLETLIFGGEAVRQSDYDRWDSLPKLINAYGPTECAVTSVIGRYDGATTIAGSIGTSVGCSTWIANQYDHNKLVPIGGVGELLLEGNILARGYLNNPEKSSAVFISDPDWLLQGGRHGRLYKTGDLVRQNEDGTISYIGRKDTQVKIRGQRLELSEVEFQVRSTVLSMTQIVADIIEPEGKKEKATLAAFFTMQSDINSGSSVHILSEVSPGIHTVRVSAEVESSLSQKLPRYMVPNVFILLDRIPLMPSGKTNRKALREIGTSLSAAHFAKLQSTNDANKRQPRNETENRFRQLWAQVLNIEAESVGIDDSFFHVGGDSITAMQLSAVVRSSLGSISTSEILQQKSIAKLSAILKSRGEISQSSQDAAVDHIERPFNLSPIQQLYVHLEPEPTRCFDQYFFLKLRSHVSIDTLSHAIEIIVARHSMLRARYRRGASGHWTQRITDDVSGSFKLHQLNCSEMSESEVAGAISKSRDVLNIETGPLTTATLLNRQSSQHLFVAVHHFAIDLVSWRIVLKEIEEVIQTGTLALPAPSVAFQTWVTSQERYAETSLQTSAVVPPSSLSYWGLTSEMNTEGSTTAHQFVLDQDTSNAILGWCNDAYNTRPMDLMISALQHSFHASFPERSGPSVFTEGHGREPWDDSVDVSQTVGWFTAMFPVLTSTNHNTSLLDTIRRVKDATKSVPKNGWEYFTSKFVTKEKAQKNVNDYPVEVLFNYAGSYQQLERGDSLFEAAELPAGSEASSWHQLRRFCIFEVACQSDRGCLVFSIISPKYSSRQGQISAWMQRFQKTLTDVPAQLENRPREWTLSDFPLAFKSYEHLQNFSDQVVPSLDIDGPGDIEDIYPCSAMQEGILVSQGKDPENYRTVLTIESFVSTENGCVDIVKIEQAWRAVVRRHSLLRAVLVENVPGAKGTMQIILRDPEPRISILSQMTRSTYSESHSDSAVSVSYTPNGLQHHLSIYQVDAENALLTLEINHAITDGYSVFNILLRDFKLAYNSQLVLNGPAYADFIKYVSAQSAEADLAFWTEQLQGAEPCLISPPSKDTSNVMESFTIDLEVVDSARIHSFCSKWEVSTATVVQTAWALVLQMYTNQSTPSFGMLTSGRNIPINEVEEIFGPLINIIPCRADFEADDSIIEVMQRVQRQFIDSYPHQTLPLIDIHRALQVGASGLFNTAISFQRNTDQTQATEGGLELRYRDVKDQVEFDISVAADDNATGLKIQLIFKADFASQAQAQFICNAYSSVINAVLEQPCVSPSKMTLLGQNDVGQMRRWNGVAPPSVHMCIHELIGDQVRSQPTAPAVKSWDGELTFAMLDELTNYLALHLRGLGVTTEVVVPLCFEKSMWTVIAWLSVLKAGGAFILLDPSLPDARVRRICEVVNAKVAITSAANTRRFSSLVSHALTLDRDFMSSLQAKEVEPLFVDIISSPENAAYIIFTSGSTGEPKGAIIEHRSYCSAALGHGSVMNMSLKTRSLQFGSYNFAGAIMEMLMVLIYGGCVCILSDEQRSPAKLPAAISELGANWAFLTSTVLAYMTPDQVPTLKTICVGGEAVRSSQIKQWATSVDLRQTYGSAETSAVVSSALLSPTSANTHVGKPTTARYWIVNAKNSDQLMPIGVPGEILMEGVVIGREYMGNPEKSAQAFIKAPTWRTAFGPRNIAARFYKTGDLGVFRDNGSLELLGRKDTQIKLRGQRIETGEIEYQVRFASSDVKEVAVELATIGGAKGPELVGFLVLEWMDSANGSFSLEIEANRKASTVIQAIQYHLEKVLPYFMVPSLLVPIAKLPLTVSGKMDRRRLRISASELSQSQLGEIRALAEMQTRQPRSKSEVQMRQLWSEVLAVEEADIGLDDSFFRLGGDSVAAMKLVGAARRLGIVLTVADIFRQPSLEMQASNLVRVELDSDDSIEPFSLLVSGDRVENLKKELASLCNIELDTLQDAYPCTPLQEGLLSLGLKRRGDYVLQIVTELSLEIKLELLQKALTDVIGSLPTLRSRVVQHREHGLVQCVLNDKLPFFEDQSIETYLSTDKSKSMDLGEPLFRVGFVGDATSERRYMISTIHHAIYDGLSLYSIIELVLDAYNGTMMEQKAQFSAFVHHTLSSDEDATGSFWQNYLSGGQFATFPELPAAVQEPLPDTFLRREIQITSKSSFTLSTIIRGALALVIGQHSGSDDVVFGALVSGRNAAVPNIEHIVGPTIAAVPIRVQVNKNATVEEYLGRIQQQSTEMIAHEQTGLPFISRLGQAPQRACNFQTFLEVQPEDDELNLQNKIGTWRTASDQEGFTNYALTLDCLIHTDKVILKASVDTAVLEQQMVESMLEQFEVLLQQLICQPVTRLVGELDYLTPTDKTAIWNHNPLLPGTFSKCLHHIIAENAIASPNSPAVCAWDGDLTYEELDILSSGLASQLKSHGVEPGTVVPLFFEKSKWTVVAVVAVLKAGGAFALLDMGLPEGRLQVVIEECHARIICASPSKAHLCSSADTHIQVVDEVAAESWTLSNIALPTDHRPDQAMYVCFTSGSTGKPKGIVISHESFATALHHQAAVLGFSPSSRVFDFASYSFDVAVHNVMTTLAVGACLCIPSDSDRRNNINGSMREMRVNIVNLTATVARLLRPEMTPDLKTLLLLGEAVNATDLEDLWGSFTIINTYGPAECTPISTINLDAQSPVEATGIGKSSGVLTWVVDPENHCKLVPTGVVGELLLEGPTLAKGYLYNPEKTQEAFIEDPEWLLAGAPGHAGRQGRLYKTGDLVKQNRDGTLVFVGRKDTQVKIRGQRLELGEIEHHLRECLNHAGQVVVDVIAPGGSKDQSILAVFLSVITTDVTQLEGDANFESATAVSADMAYLALRDNVHTALLKRLPSYMVPATYFCLRSIPQTPSGKTDRKQLRQLGAEITKEKLVELRGQGENAKRQPETVRQEELQSLWSIVLKSATASIGIDDNFFLLGGDSVAAMKLVAEARKMDLYLTVANVFAHPILKDQATILTASESTTALIPEPFELLNNAEPLSNLLEELSSLCGVEPSTVQDAYPCTPLQEGLLSLTAKNANGYIMQAILELSPLAHIQKVKKSWNTVISSNSILRTRIVQHETHGLLQVVLSEEPEWCENKSLPSYLEQDKLQGMGLGTPLCRFAVIESDKHESRQLVWTVHHALYDGGSLPLIMDQVASNYAVAEAEAPAPAARPPFSLFVQHIQNQSLDESQAFWKDYFADGHYSPFPALPSTVQKLQPASILERDFNLRTPSTTTMSSLLRGALSLLISSFSASSDVVFGSVVSGRNAPVPGSENIVGPTIATLPLRFQIVKTMLVKDYLESIQAEAAKMIAFEQSGLQRIAKASDAASSACEFQTLLVVQPAEADMDSSDAMGTWRSSTETAAFSSYAVMIECLLGKDNMKIRTSFDSNIVSAEAMSNMITYFCRLAEELSLHSGKTIGAIQTLTQEDLALIWEWNSELPALQNTCPHDLFVQQALASPLSQALCASDASYTYAQLHDLSSRFAGSLLHLNLSKDSIIPICFGKSTLAIVAMLGINKAGYSWLPLNPADGSSRHQTILQQASAQVIVMPEQQSHIQFPTEYRRLIISPGSLAQLPASSQLPQVSPDSTMYVLFTSGSTGKPKGVVLQHKSVATSVLHHGKRFGYEKDSRMLQFSSYTFDAAISEIFGTFAFGGCVCVPTENERLSDLAGFINSYSVNISMITPTVARMLDSDSVPTINTLVLCGEPVLQSDYEKWQAIPTVFNGYGPTECSIYAVTGARKELTKHAACIGRSVGCATWIVDPKDHNSLSPIGAIGELLLEGWTVANGYLNNAEKSSDVFIDSPSWLEAGCGQIPGRNGRVYKTGDLARYNSDGTISFIGRKDNQVKIRGQRFELGEVDHHVQACLPSASVVSSQVILPEGQKQKAMLAVFLTAPDLSNSNDMTLGSSFTVNGLELTNVHVHVADQLAQRLPPYMIPSIYFKIQEMPISVAGKIDRKRLLQISTGISAQQIADLQAVGAKTMPKTAAEQQLQELWAKTLAVNTDTIAREDNFFRLGGDSIAAMKLVALCRTRGIALSVADIFKHPILQAQAEFTSIAEETIPTMEPFSLIPSIAVDTLTNDVSALCGLKSSEIEDVYPCTPLQEGLLSLTSKKSGQYTLQAALELSASIDLGSFKEVWSTVIQENAILRTKIVQHPGAGLVQVVHRRPAQWFAGNDLDSFLKSDSETAMSLGDDLCRFSIIVDAKTFTRTFVWTVHHALYDGWSLSLILNAAFEHYLNKSAPKPATAFNNFVKYTMDNKEDSETYWRKYLGVGGLSVFPELPTSVREPAADSTLSAAFEFANNTSATAATTIRAALAILISHYTGSRDVVFGATVSGRNAPMPGIADVAGPTIATVPVRATMDPNMEIGEFMTILQNDAMDMVEFEQIGLQNIHRLGSAGRNACSFQTLLVVQPKENDFEDENELGKWRNSTDQNSFATYALTLECFMTATGVKIRSSFDTSVLAPWQMELLLSRFGALLTMLSTVESTKRLQDLSLVSESESTLLWQWNQRVPELVDSTIQDLIAKQANSRPKEQAITAWDGNLTYKKLDELSSALAAHLISLGVEANSIVPICFERSMWTIVAMLAVNKAGATFVAISYQDSPERQAYILHETRSSIILTSAAYENVGAALDCSTFAVSGASLASLTPVSFDTAQLLRRRSIPSSGTYIIYTSGSTGQPKGVLLEHNAVATSCINHGRVYGFGPTSRVFQFSSYSFDACIVEIYTTLIWGGCICVPSEADRLGNLAGIFNDMHANVLQITPTVARTIQPASVPELEVLILCGEAISPSDYVQWQHVPRLMNGYGPTEASICSTVQVYNKSSLQIDSIGTGVGCATWVVDQQDHNKLAPIGSIGELLIEGNTLARGYLNSPQKTSAAFISSPRWLQEGTKNCAGRNSRLYKTGDLVRYNANGSLSYLGRKDTQAKLRGQRLELGEVEHQLQRCIPSVDHTVAEVIAPAGRKDKAMLAAFITMQPSATARSDIFIDNVELTGSIDLVAINPHIDSSLSQHLPPYMVPTIFIRLAHLPLLPSGKTDRKKLRQIGESLTPQNLIDLQAKRVRSKRLPNTEPEKRLQKLWSQVLNVDTVNIGLDDNFFRLGGDSIASMKLVSMARSEDITLAVADIAKLPMLEDQARAMKEAVDVAPATPSKPFELIDEIIRSDVQQDVARLMPTHEIEDIFPATTFQSDTIQQSVECPQQGFNYFYFDIAHDFDVARLLESCRATANHYAVLRSAFVHCRGKFWQAILSHLDAPVHIIKSQGPIATTFDKTCFKDTQTGFQLGEPLTAFWLIQHETEGSRLIVRLSHAQYDGISFSILISSIFDHYKSNSLRPVVEFSTYLKYAKAHEGQYVSYWKTLLDGAPPTQFPALLSDDVSNSNTEAHRISLQRSISLSALPENTTLASVTSAAWAVLLSSITGDNDVVYGSLVAGRNANFDGIEDVAGPCNNAIPVRAQLEPDMTPAELFTSIQRQQLLIGEADCLGMGDIITKATNWPKAFKFDTIVKHQGIDENFTFDLNGQPVKVGYFENPADIPAKYVGVFTYPEADGVKVQIIASSMLLSAETASWLLGRVCQSIQILLSAKDEPLSVSMDRIADMSALAMA